MGNGGWLANTALPNKLVREGIEDGTITELQGYSHIRPEQRYGDQNSRIDFLLSSEQRPVCYVEVKNCHLRRRDDLAEFPDAVSARAAKHGGIGANGVAWPSLLLYFAFSPWTASSSTSRGMWTNV